MTGFDLGPEQQQGGFDLGPEQLLQNVSSRRASSKSVDFSLRLLKKFHKIRHGGWLDLGPEQQIAGRLRLHLNVSPEHTPKEAVRKSNVRVSMI